MIVDEHIQVADLCTLQFREPLEYELYPEQADLYIPKITTQELKVQVLTTEAIDTADKLYLVMYTDKGYQLTSLIKKFAITLVSTGIYQANVTLSKNEIASIAEDTIVYFSIETNDATPTVYATSLWYKINPSYTADLKQITYAHSENDWNVQFSTNEFTLTVECGFVPMDSRDEQETDDFSQQDMVNETVYGDEYEVLGLNFGNVLGIPNWLRLKLSRASLCDTFKVSGTSITRIKGAKMEKTKDTYSGLAMYKLDVQKIKNYLQ